MKWNKITKFVRSQGHTSQDFFSCGNLRMGMTKDPAIQYGQDVVGLIIFPITQFPNFPLGYLCNKSIQIS